MEYYIAMYVKDPPLLISRNGSEYFMGLHGPNYLHMSVEIRLPLLGWTSSIFYQQQLGRPVP
jgi:hypothetical protein